MAQSRELRAFTFEKMTSRPITSLRQRLDSTNVPLNPKVYTIATLPDLISRLPLIDASDPTDEDEDREIRFLLSADHQPTLFFGMSGAPSRRGTVASHSQLSHTKNCGQCVSAGDIRLKNDGKVDGIRNRSGRFEPGVQTLQYAIAEMIRQGVQFAENIVIEEHYREVNEGVSRSRCKKHE